MGRCWGDPWGDVWMEEVGGIHGEMESWDGGGGGDPWGDGEMGWGEVGGIHGEMLGRSMGRCLDGRGWGDPWGDGELGWKGLAVSVWRMAEMKVSPPPSRCPPPPLGVPLPISVSPPPSPCPPPHLRVPPPGSGGRPEAHGAPGRGGGGGCGHPTAEGRGHQRRAEPQEGANGPEGRRGSEARRQRVRGARGESHGAPAEQVGGAGGQPDPSAGDTGNCLRDGDGQFGHREPHCGDGGAPLGVGTPTSGSPLGWGHPFWG